MIGGGGLFFFFSFSLFSFLFPLLSIWQKIHFFYSKRAPSPAKTWNFSWKKGIFLLKKTSQPLKKLKFCIKNDKKFPERASSPTKTEVLHEKLKTVLPMGILKKKILDPQQKWQIDKKFTQKNTHPHNNLKFCMKNIKSSYLWGFWKKNSRPPTSPNF